MRRSEYILQRVGGREGGFVEVHKRVALFSCLVAWVEEEKRGASLPAVARDRWRCPLSPHPSSGIEQFIISVCFSLTLYATYSIIFIQSAEQEQGAPQPTLPLHGSIKQQTGPREEKEEKKEIQVWRRKGVLLHQPEVGRSRIVGIGIASLLVHTYAKESAMEIRLASRTGRATLALFDLSVKESVVLNFRKNIVC